MMDVNQDNDSDRTESYTPPPLDITNDLNNSSEKENNYRDSSPIKQQSIIILDDSYDQVITNEPSSHLFSSPFHSSQNPFCF
jgi:hypothetical protein